VIYVFDTSAFVVLFKTFYRGNFPTLWEKFDLLIAEGKILSTREVKREINDQDDSLSEWAKDNSYIFTTPSAGEAGVVANIYSRPHFQANIEQKKILKGGLNADPFVIAKASVSGGAVVTLEKFKRNAAKIPNICKDLEIDCMNLEDFMNSEGWKF